MFQGRSDGKLAAVDAHTGGILWSQDMGVGTQASPITFEVDGEQYVSILAGWGGSPMLMGSLSAQSGWVGRQYPRRLLTYKLDADTPLPASPPPVTAVEVVAAPDFKVDPEKAEHGKLTYATQCMLCHGTAAVAGGYAPDLRASRVPLDATAFAAIVRDGALTARGMPPFEELSDAQLEALQHYLRERANDEPSLFDKAAMLTRFGWVFIKMQLMKYGLMG